MPPERSFRIDGTPGSGGGVLGLDEAGRGSVIGPLVVGGFLTDPDRLGSLRLLGARDSKRVSPRRRPIIFNDLRLVGRRVWISLEPGTIDPRVRRGELNTLEAEAFAELIRSTRPDRVFVDACDPNARRFGRLLRGLSGTSARVTSAHHADRDYPIVGAASIVAKVQRDWQISELKRRLGADFGSGYPSDPRSVEFARAALQGGGPAPDWLRASWATTERIMPARPGPTLEQFP